MIEMCTNLIMWHIPKWLIKTCS